MQLDVHYRYQHGKNNLAFHIRFQEINDIYSASSIKKINSILRKVHNINVGLNCIHLKHIRKK